MGTLLLIQRFLGKQTGKHLLQTQDVSERNQEHFLCLGHKFSPHTNVAHMGKQGNNVCATMCTLMKCI